MREHWYLVLLQLFSTFVITVAALSTKQHCYILGSPENGEEMLNGESEVKPQDVNGEVKNEVGKEGHRI